MEHEQPEAMNGLESNQADVAQLVEQPIRNRQVIGSSPIVGSSDKHLQL